MHLRPFRETDLDTLYAIDQVCFAEGIAYSKSDLSDFLQQPRSFNQVAESEPGTIVGFCIAQEYTQRRKRIGHIVTIDVLPNARRMGIGGALMEAVEAHFRTLFTECIHLEVAVDNLGAQNFYQRCGFEIIGRIPNYYLGRLDALAMQKVIG
jgi:[ribosomal protein S18]-alanine N-acetyltransferase